MQDFGRNQRKATRLIVSIIPQYRGRFAPSPTGPLHLGSLYTALASFLQARAQQGVWRVRIDDIDIFRNEPQASDKILKTLELHGLHWDGAIVFQSRNLGGYRQAIDELESMGLLYACTCSRKALAAFEPSGVYPGLCCEAMRDRNSPHALRIKAMGKVIEFSDKLQGLYRQVLSDFVIKRKEGLFAYHLATVIDDAEAEITEVMRGVDLLECTPQQIYLQNCLGLSTPDYRHVPIIVDANGQKLSKQSKAPAVEDDKASANLFMLLGWLNQSPPPELKRAPVDEILNWAMEHWNVDQLILKAAQPMK